MLLDRNLHIHLKQTPILQEKTNAGNRRNCHIDKKKTNRIIYGRIRNQNMRPCKIQPVNHWMERRRSVIYLFNDGKTCKMG